MRWRKMGRRRRRRTPTGRRRGSRPQDAAAWLNAGMLYHQAGPDGQRRAAAALTKALALGAGQCL